jgi:hypothetical protein
MHFQSKLFGTLDKMDIDVAIDAMIRCRKQMYAHNTTSTTFAWWASKEPLSGIDLGTALLLLSVICGSDFKYSTITEMAQADLSWSRSSPFVAVAIFDARMQRRKESS